MVESGMTPEQVLLSATRDAAGCLGIAAGQLAPGRWADFLVLGANLLEDIANTHSLEWAHIAGNRVW